MMYPLLTDPLFESPSDIPKDPFELLKVLLVLFPQATVVNGEHKGKSLSRAARASGGGVLGKNAVGSTVFKNGGSDIIPYLKKNEALENESVIYPFGYSECLVYENGFSADLLSLDGKVGLCEKDSFMLIFALSGNYTVSHFGGTFHLTAGSLVFVPADFRIETVGAGKLIIIHT